MAARTPSRQELIRRRRSSGFVGRQDQIAAFRDCLGRSPEDTAQFLFHVRGPAGVGKSTLARRLEGMAREERAVTAYVDESVSDVLEAMEAISAQFTQQGAALKNFDKLLVNYRQRRHEAVAGAGPAASGDGTGADTAADEPPGAGRGGGGPAPSPSSMVASQIGLVGLGMIPGLGAFTGAVDPGRLAAGADRVKALLGARLRSHEDVQLVLSPLRALVPVFLGDLAEVARHKPWLVLFFDTYERTGPLLDSWLRDILVSDRYGEVPANVLVVLAGQARLAARCWEDWLDLVTDWPLEVFTDAEARRLLTAKGVTDERVVDVILTLSERLPVLVSTLAETRPSRASDLGDPSGTAVERFLKWETDSVRRAAALACALPQELDEDVYRAAVDTEAAELFAWLRALPFVTDHAGHCRYHDVVRNAMLRLQRQQSPARWQQQHTRLADAFLHRRIGIEEGAAPPEGRWGDERWRGSRLQETYHRLCADPGAALPGALRELLDAYDHGIGTLRRWIQTLCRAGRDSGAPALGSWGQRLLAAVEEEPHPGVAVLTALLTHGGLDARGRSFAYVLRGRDRRVAGQYAEATDDCSRAIALDPDCERAHYGRGCALYFTGQYDRALDDLGRAVALNPDDADNVTVRGMTYSALGRYEEAVADYDRAIGITPGHAGLYAFRAGALRWLRRYEEVLADCDRAIELNPGYGHAFTLRAEALQELGRYDEASADYGRAIDIGPDDVYAYISRAEFFQKSGRSGEALVDYSRAIELDSDRAHVFTRRAGLFQAAGRCDDALADLDRAVAADPADDLALALRASAYKSMGRYDDALADLDRALGTDSSKAFSLSLRGKILRLTGRYEAALRDLDRAIELHPDDTFALNEHALSCHMEQRYDDAVSDLNRVIEIQPDSSWGHYEMAIVLRALGRPEHERFLGRAVDLLTAETGDGGTLPESAGHTGNLFLAHFSGGSRSEAEFHFDEFLRISTTRGEVDELLADLSGLVAAAPSERERVLPFVRRLQDARTGISATAF